MCTYSYNPLCVQNNDKVKVLPRGWIKILLHSHTPGKSNWLNVILRYMNMSMLAVEFSITFLNIHNVWTVPIECYQRVHKMHFFLSPPTQCQQSLLLRRSRCQGNADRPNIVFHLKQVYSRLYNVVPFFTIVWMPRLEHCWCFVVTMVIINSLLTYHK